MMVLVAALAVTATAQDMIRDVDLSSPDMVSAEMTRAEVKAAVSKGTAVMSAIVFALVFGTLVYFGYRTLREINMLCNSTT
jgi:site-specific recombinase